MTKEELRARLRQERARLADRGGPAVSAAAQRHILSSPVWTAAGIVALYVALPEEMDTSLLQHMARLDMKQLWLPRCLPQKGPGAMEFAQSQTARLAPGPFGILEPDPALCPAAPDHLAPDLVLVPGIAFDREGYRLGYGGGYYDRLISRAEQDPAWAQTRFLGFVPAPLVAERLPRDSWDRPVHGLATEEGLMWL